MLLDYSKLLIKSQTKGLISKTKVFDIIDPDSQEVVGTAKEVTGFIAGLLGGATIEVRDGDGDLAFSVTRSGLIFKKDQVVDTKGKTVGRFKAKMFSLSGGFHIYDAEGTHIAEIQGKMFKAEYKFLSPKKAEMGTVSRTWGGLAKSLFSDGNTFGVQITPKYAEDTTTKTLIIGAVIALETIFKKKGSSSSDDEGGGDDE